MCGRLRLGGMTLPSILAFTGLCVLLALTPGPDTFLVLRFSLVRVRAGVAASIGSAIGSLVWAAAVAFGLAALLEQLDFGARSANQS